MSNKDSPIEQLEAQALLVATQMQARAKAHHKARLPEKVYRAAIIMNDKALEIEMGTLEIRQTSTEALKEFILRAMQEKEANA